MNEEGNNAAQQWLQGVTVGTCAVKSSTDSPYIILLFE